MHIISVLLARDCVVYIPSSASVSFLVARGWRRAEARLLSSCQWSPFITLHFCVSLLFPSCLSVVRCCVGCRLDPRWVWHKRWLGSREQKQEEKHNEMRVICQGEKVFGERI